MRAPAPSATSDERSLPSLQESFAATQAQRALNRWVMVLVLLCCATPVLASYLTYYVIRPEGRSIYGDLIEPQHPLPALTATARDGSSVDLRALKGQWLLVAVGDAACDELCEQLLYLQRQLREMMGREKVRLDRVWLVTDTATVPDRLDAALNDATVLRVPRDQLAQWLFPAPSHALSDHLYLVDPLGHWMMRLPARMGTTGAVRAKRDLELLLRASASWDPPGR